MKQLMNKSIIVAIAIFFVPLIGWSREFDYASYVQTTLQDIIAEEQNHSPEQPEIKKFAEYVQLECRVSKYRVSCYFNSIRPISENKKNAISLWMETLKIAPTQAFIYQQEIKVSEGTKMHWIPIQEQLVPHIKQELVKRDAIDLFVILIGQVGSEFVFIATEFEKPISLVKNSI